MVGWAKSNCRIVADPLVSTEHVVNLARREPTLPAINVTSNTSKRLDPVKAFLLRCCRFSS
jgi:hypothetical protein